MARLNDPGYACSLCQKPYTSKGWLERHLVGKHGWVKPNPGHQRQPQPGSAKQVAAAFVRQALLARDTWDAYRYADGDRGMRNAKFEFLYTDPVGHKNYKKWLF